MASYETAPNLFVTVGDIHFAYRKIGPARGIVSSATPLVLFMHYRGTMDHWDPAFVNPLAANRLVVLIDNAGVGRSGGEVPETLAGWAAHYINVIKALGFYEIDLLGFSMGGCVAQLVALNSPPGLVRRLVLCGTTPSTGSGTVTAPLGPFNQLKAAATPQEHRDAFLATFFTPTPRSQAAGAAAWDRITQARKNRVDYVAPDAAYRQAIAFVRFMDPKEANAASYNRFQQLSLPVLIANGNDDLLLPTENSILMWKMLSHAKAQLHLYPDSGHGFLYQYADQFAPLVNDFLDSVQ